MTTTTDNNEIFPEGQERWIIGELQKHLDYLRYVAQRGYDVSDAEIKEVEEDITRRKEALAKRQVS